MNDTEKAAVLELIDAIRRYQNAHGPQHYKLGDIEQMQQRISAQHELAEQRLEAMINQVHNTIEANQ